jgi:hypothetical protein
MRKAALAALLLTACASTRATVQITKPEMRIVQTSAIPAAARHVAGNIPVSYALRVANRSDETITLKRVTLQSVGAGAYSVSTSLPFDVTIAPSQYQIVEFSAGAVASTSVVGVNGPVSLRVIAHFNSSVGEFDEIVVQQVNDQRGSRGGE